MRAGNTPVTAGTAKKTGKRGILTHHPEVRTSKKHTVSGARFYASTSSMHAKHRPLKQVKYKPWYATGLKAAGLWISPYEVHDAMPALHVEQRTTGAAHDALSRGKS